MKKETVLFTMTANEPIFLPLWLSYYTQFFKGEDIYVIYHDIVGDWFEKLQWQYKFNAVKWEDHVLNGKFSDVGKVPWDYFYKQLDAFMSNLFAMGYERIVSSDVDEFIIASPTKYKGLNDFLEQHKDKDVIHCTGFEVVQGEAEDMVDFSRPILISQRKMFVKDPRYNKPLIFKTMHEWIPGRHQFVGVPLDHNLLDDLYLFHLHRVDLVPYLNRPSQNRRLELYLERKDEFVEMSESFKGVL